jgi:hypothetical protein
LPTTNFNKLTTRIGFRLARNEIIVLEKYKLYNSKILRAASIDSPKKV